MQDIFDRIFAQNNMFSSEKTFTTTKIGGLTFNEPFTAEIEGCFNRALISYSKSNNSKIMPKINNKGKSFELECSQLFSYYFGMEMAKNVK